MEEPIQNFEQLSKNENIENTQENSKTDNIQDNACGDIKDIDNDVNNIQASAILTDEEKRTFISKFINQLSDTIKDLEQQKNKSPEILVIDRFEGQFVVCEDRQTGQMINLQKSELPENIKEGDVLKYGENGYKIDEIERQNIEERIKNKVKNLFEE